MVRDESVMLKFQAPHDHTWETDNREYFFGTNGDGRAPTSLPAEKTVFSLNAYRGLSEMWLRAPDLMTDKANEDLAEADGQLTLFFANRDFGEDILGALDPELQFIAVQQDFRDQQWVPAIKLPSFALQLRMKDSEDTKREFRRVFQTFIGFVNIVGGMEGQPQFDLGQEKLSDESEIYSATYVDPKGGYDGPVPINLNFSPSLAFVGDRVIFSSTLGLAKDLTQMPEADELGPNNTDARLDAEILAQILNENREQLIAQNMLEEGNSREEAEAAIGVLFEVLHLVDDVKLDFVVKPELLDLNLKLNLKPF